MENSTSGRNDSVYGIVATTSTELVLQPICSRKQSMRTAWLGLVIFAILSLLLAIFLAFLIMFCILAALSTTAPLLQNHWITKVVIAAIWGLCAVSIACFTGKAAWVSGYTTFTFDRLQRQFVIHTMNVFGRKSVRMIPFERIQEVKLQEYEGDGITMTLSLLLDKQKILGFSQQETITLSRFSSEHYKTVANLTALKHHQELLRSIREILGLSTHDIDKWLKEFRIPTESEIQQQKAEAISEVKDMLKTVGKMIFSSDQTRQEELAIWREKIRESPEDPKAWEQFAMLSALQKNSSEEEFVNAYRRAEGLYRDRGDVENAQRIAKTLQRFAEK
ncbi:MAG: hypothetical protein DCF19_08890 [Pseudanabaena frigida]|uniref:Uncharacterized protein n=1 Tax=Pseudanabaena frigida TaxID=945775 RepID=A0A2W4YEY1_9CYAN|nr:MAG: hypothetical protein DCF19_08890 [Pseudanabaena frigida]